MKKLSKRALSLLLTLVMAAGMATTAFAASGGSQTTDESDTEAEEPAGSKADSGIQTYADTSSHGNIYAYWTDTTLYLFSDGYASQYPGYTDITGRQYGYWTGTDEYYVPWFDNITDFTTVRILEPIYPTYTDNWFWDTWNVTSWVGLSNIKMDYCVSAENMFANSGFDDTAMQTVQSYNMSGCEDVSGMFYGSDIQHADLSSWDMNSVRGMSSLFFNCSDLISVTFPSSASKCPAPTGNGMDEVFGRCDSLTTINNINNIDTSSVARMEYMFYWDSALTSIDISGWDLHNVANADSMFELCTNLENIKLTSTQSKSFRNLQRGYEMFSQCSSLKSVSDLHLDLWDISNGVNFEYMFYSCVSIEGTIDVSMWDFSNSPRCADMFLRCRSVEYILLPTDKTHGLDDIGDKWVASSMFSQCSSLKEIDLSGFTLTEAANDEYYHIGSRYIIDEGYNYNDGYADDHMLQKVTLGSGIQISIYFPTTSSDYIEGADGNWHTTDGQSYAPDSVPAGAGVYYATTTHFWDSGKVTKEAACTSAGERTYTCTLCGVTKTETIAALGHSYSVTDSSLTDDFTQGRLYLTCSRCGTTATISPCDVARTTTKEPTCTESGLFTYTISGTYEGRFYSTQQTRTISATGHDYDVVSCDADLKFALVSDNADAFRSQIVKYAQNHVGDPYVKGGRGYSMWDQGVNDTGYWPVFDCSGLTQYIYMYALKDDYGLSISFAGSEGGWDVASQWNYEYAYAIDVTSDMTYDGFISQLKPGDLVFFNRQADGTPGHVGVYIGNGQIIDAYCDEKGNGEVIIETLKNDRDWDSVMGARRIIAAVGESYDCESTITIRCGSCGDTQVLTGDTVTVAEATLPSCSSEGSARYRISSLYENTLYISSCTKTVPATQHIQNYNTGIATFNYSAGTADLTCTCSICGDEVTAYGLLPDYDISYSDYDVDTGEYGIALMSMSLRVVDENGNAYVYQREVTEDDMEEAEHVHTWVLIEGIGTDATCTEDGIREYICSECGVTMTVESEATGHDWKAGFEWNSDYTACTAAFICELCGQEEHVQADITSETNGTVTIYTAYAVFNGETYVDTETVDTITQEPVKQGNDGDDTDTGSGSGMGTKETAAGTGSNVNTAKSATKDTAAATVPIATKTVNVGSDDGTSSSDTTNTSVSTGTAANDTSSAENSNSGGNTTTTDDPKTGDNILPVILFAEAAVLCGCAGIAAVVKKRGSEKS